MKVLVFSDSHGRLAPMIEAIHAEKPDHVLHLGDCVRDFQALKQQFPTLPMTNVPGNCDYGNTDPLYQVITLEGCRIFLTHGHPYQVKYMYLRVIYAALEQDANLLVFGHTHQAECFKEQGLWVLNPGAAKQGCYGIIHIQNGKLQLRLEPQS